MRTNSRWTGKTILITGVSGVIGQALRAACEDLGAARVVGVDSSDADLRDLEAAQKIISSHRPSLVFHLAARVSGIMGNMRDRARAYVDNIRINTNVVEAAYQGGVTKMVAMGTTAIYSDLVPMPMAEKDLWLGAPHVSEAPYGHAKRAMLAQLEAYKEQYGFEFAYAISTNLYGPHDRFDEHHGHVIPSLVSKFTRAVQQGEPVSVWGSGMPRRDFLFAKDAATALLLMAEKGEGAINMASGTTVSIRECAEMIADVSGYDREIVWDANMPNGQMMRAYDTTRLKQLGFDPQYDLRRGLEETFQWYRSNQALARR